MCASAAERTTCWSEGRTRVAIREVNDRPGWWHWRLCAEHLVVARRGTRSFAVDRVNCGKPFECKGMCLVREPDAGNLPVRFDEEGVETE
jgi:hypothetical protein